MDSYWTRSNYFAAFEIAAAAGAWVVLNANDLRLGHWSIFLGVFLTAGWIFSNLKSHDYVAYWWKALQEVEASIDWVTKPDYISNYEARRKKRHVLGNLPYSFFTNWLVPIFFLVVWLCVVCIDWNGAPCK